MRDDDPDRDAILARRRKLIGAALAGITTVAGCGDNEPPPQVCLSPMVVEETPVEEPPPEVPPEEPEVSPQPCLSVVAPPPPDEPEPPPEKPGDHVG
jgi:hypothetical protein